MDVVDRLIINQLQGGFPVCDSPYQVVSEQLGLTETELIARINSMLESGLLSRFGPMYHAEEMGVALTLAALKVPNQQFDQIAEIVNSFPEVAHNYARSHELNMWFVIATDNPDNISDVIKSIEEKTDLPVYNMPKINEYFIGLKLQA